MEQPLFVQYGCGLCAPPTWRNYDASPTLRLQRLPLLGRFVPTGPSIAPRFPENVLYGDIVRGLPIAESSCDAVYCAHVLEHLALTDLRIALANTIRLLKPGAPFRLVVPDMEAAVRSYAEATDAGAVHRLMSGIGRRRRPRGGPALLREWLGASHHLWMWDYKGLAAELHAAGFVDIRRASFGDSALDAFRDVEERDRWDGHLGIEARRPHGRYVTTTPYDPPFYDAPTRNAQDASVQNPGGR